MYKRFVKRALDIIISLIFLPIILFVIIIIIPFVFINDPGPIFYNSKRLGYKCKAFKMFKIRSMYVNAPDLRNKDGSTFNSSTDNRVTTVGKFLRKTSIDELPQVFNILIGDMSFIGPRPGLPDGEWANYSEDEACRRSVRPGITGYSQAYFRNSDTMSERKKNDIYYSQNVCFRLDCKILVKTIKTVVKRENINRNDEQNQQDKSKTSDKVSTNDWR